MRIGLVDVDSHNFPNLPLMKISAWHKAKGDSVVWANGFEHYDKVYISKVFTFTPDIDFCPDADEIIYGGTGYGLQNKLPDEVEHIYPDYSLYPELTKNIAYGFLTRGCPRNCDYCIVSEKEGYRSIHVADLSEFWRGQKHIKLLDANLLACRGREKLLQQLIDSRAYIDFTQGLDIRLINCHITEMINAMKVKMLHFAWDDADEDLTEDFERFKERTHLDERKLCCYVLTNYNSTYEQDLYRVRKLIELGYHPYVMIYEKGEHSRFLTDLARWANNPRIYRSCAFEDYVPRKDGRTCGELYWRILKLA